MIVKGKKEDIAVGLNNSLVNNSTFDRKRARKFLGLIFVSTVIGGIVVGCGQQSEDRVATKSSSVVPPSYTPRAEDENVLGNVGADRACVPEVIDIDHQRNTAYFEYHGQPGDEVNLNIIMKGKPSIEQSFKLGDGNTGWQVPTDIFNGDIEKVVVSAKGRTGQPGSCEIDVA